MATRAGDGRQYSVPLHRWASRALQAPVLERRQVAPHLGCPCRLDVADQYAFAFLELRDDVAPRIDQHAVTVGAATVRMTAALRGGKHVALVLDRPRPQQQRPVSCAG